MFLWNYSPGFLTTKGTHSWSTATQLLLVGHSMVVATLKKFKCTTLITSYFYRTDIIIFALKYKYFVSDTNLVMWLGYMYLSIFIRRLWCKYKVNHYHDKTINYIHDLHDLHQFTYNAFTNSSHISKPTINDWIYKYCMSQIFFGISKSIVI